jgi:hypothetical protein
MKRYLPIIAILLMVTLTAVPTANATVAPSRAEKIVRNYLNEKERRVGLPQPVIKCWVLSTRRTRCNIHTRSEGFWNVENDKVDVYNGGGINWERRYGH